MAPIKVLGCPTVADNTLSYNPGKKRRASFSSSPKKGDVVRVDLAVLAADVFAAAGAVIRLTGSTEFPQTKSTVLELELDDASSVPRLVYEINDALFGTLGVKALKQRLQER